MNKRKKLLLPILLAVLTLGMVSTYRTETSSAYFTTYAIAKGGPWLRIGPTRNKIKDEYTAGRKSVSVQNVGEYDCYARVVVLAPEWLLPFPARQGEKDSGNYLYVYDPNAQSGASDVLWRFGGDGYWYYDKILKPGESTPTLMVETSWLLMTKELEEQMKTCDVVIVDEFTMVRYDENGNPWADWKWQKGSDVE